MRILLVGGAVRDHVIGIVPIDQDYVVVGATQEDMISMGYKQVGADFPVFIDHNKTEFALARTERSTGKGYHDFVVDFAPTTTIEQDLYRRDFTMNAMALDENNKLIDPYGGKQDIKDKLIRVVNPDTFHEDPVRVLRAARFSARYGFELADQTLECIKRCKDDGRISALSIDRVWKEFDKALDYDFLKFIECLRDIGLLELLGIKVKDWERLSKNMSNLRHTTKLVKYTVFSQCCDLTKIKAKVPNIYKKFPMLCVCRGFDENHVLKLVLNTKDYEKELNNYLISTNPSIKPMIDEARHRCKNVYHGDSDLTGKELGALIKSRQLQSIKELLCFGFC